MRNFEQRKAEILRRSEVRIQKRKQTQRRLLALCVPLVLCIGLGVWQVWEMRPPAAPAEMNAAMGSYTPGGALYSMDEAVEHSAAQGVVLQYTVQVFYGEEMVSEYSGGEAEQIFRIFDSASTVSKSHSTVAGDGEAQYEMADEKQTAVVRICLSDGAGSKTVYIWDGTTLTNEENTEVYSLTERQREALEDLLHIRRE